MLLISFLCALIFGQHPQSVYIRGIRCNFSEKYANKNISCYGKSYSRNISTVNIRGFLKSPLSDIFAKKRIFIKLLLKIFPRVMLKLLYKYGMTYREVLHITNIDICHLSETKQENLLVDQLVKLINTSAPWILHLCPYTVRFFDFSLATT